MAQSAGSAPRPGTCRPEHRRDGLGFGLLALAVVVASREWWGLPGIVGDVVHAVTAGTIGRIAYALPLVLLAFGIWVLRAPKDEAVTNRVVVGTVALTVAACGLARLTEERHPNPPDGADGMRAASRDHRVPHPPARSRPRPPAPEPWCCWRCWRCSGCWCSPAPRSG